LAFVNQLIVALFFGFRRSRAELDHHFFIGSYFSTKMKLHVQLSAKSRFHYMELNPLSLKKISKLCVQV